MSLKLRGGFDLRDEAKRAKQYPHSIVGQEIVAGRQTTKLEISPPGGSVYYIWIDEETSLPVQLQTAMQNALQTTFTFISNGAEAIVGVIYLVKSKSGQVISVETAVAENQTLQDNVFASGRVRLSEKQ